jgi:hypothetical protein
MGLADILPQPLEHAVLVNLAYDRLELMVFPLTLPESNGVILVNKLLIVEQALPNGVVLLPAEGDKEDGGQQHGIDEDGEGDSPDIEDDQDEPPHAAQGVAADGRDGIHVAIAGHVESLEVGQKHAADCDCGHRDPVAGHQDRLVQRRALQLEGRVEGPDEQRRVGLALG